MADELLLPQVEESVQERLAGAEGADIHISAPGLLKNPAQQAERVKPSTEVGLGGTLIQWPQNRLYLPAPAHCL